MEDQSAAGGERSAKEPAKENNSFLAGDLAKACWRHACTLTSLQPSPLVDRETRSTFTCVLDALPVLVLAQSKTLAAASLLQV